jgi:hypothetical protein
MVLNYATYTSEDNETTNLQLYFWRCAIEHFKEIQEAEKVATEVGGIDHDIDVVSSVAIVLAGTSVSQLLGQQQTASQKQGSKVPQPLSIFDTAIAQADPALRQRLAEFIKVYDAIRHFGEQKHAIVGNVDEMRLCDLMTTAQDVWRAVLTQNNLSTAEFCNTFIPTPKATPER